MVFLCKRVIAPFRVNFQGCKLLMHGDASTQRILQVCDCWLSMWGCSTCSPLSDFSFPRNTGFMRLFLGDMEGNLSSPLFRPCFWGVTLKNNDCKRSREATHLKVSMLCKWTVEKCKLNLVWKKHVFPQEIANTWFQLITSKFVHPSYPAAFSCNWYLPKKQTKLAVIIPPGLPKIGKNHGSDPWIFSGFFITSPSFFWGLLLEVFSQLGWSKVFHKQIRSSPWNYQLTTQKWWRDKGFSDAFFGGGFKGLCFNCHIRPPGLRSQWLYELIGRWTITCHDLQAFVTACFIKGFVSSEKDQLLFGACLLWTKLPFWPIIEIQITQP